KKSVVDDFFSALFANNSTVSDDNTPANNIISNDNEQDESNIMDEEEQSNHGGRKRERVLDEFDEYSLLSKRRGSDRSKNNFKRKAIEARESIQDRDIDWSTVKPESRMLVRQLPKFIDKQDVMNYFSKYGEVLEVVQKTPFGFVHFENPEACAQAVQVENGKPFHGIVLDLEICKRKPFFARAAERDVREPNAREPAPVEEPPRNANNHQQQQYHHQQMQHQEENRGYNNNNNSNEVPTVQIVAWDNVAYGYTDYIERVFSSNHIRASSITLPYTKESRESIVKQMILEGVKAIVMIDRHNELITKIYLQVFAPAENGQGVRYDEYDSVTAIEAVSIIRRA
ncbi:uncharacterized protein EV154DRAFT_401774, partial [Mucor mucedo]|uniref:uncharacterized protein n=1 Tax=Mucor mucedo TaxID=29922 RepID=UPI00221F6C82